MLRGNKRFFVIASLLVMNTVCKSGATECFLESINISPQTATLDHLAPPPRNSQRFLAFHGKLPQGCVAVESNLLNVVWSVSDTQNIEIDTQQGAAFGTVTCINPTKGPVSVKATLPASKNNGHEATGAATIQCR
jgi:hypothetical protein